METQVQAASRSVTSRSIESDLDSYLDAIADATAIFREAVDAYLNSESEGACWRHAGKLSEHLRLLDDLQQKFETRIHPQSALGNLVCGMIDPLNGVSRLLKDMKRQITGFAIESGFSSPHRYVPANLVADVQELTDEVCTAVDVLVESYRPSLLWWEQPSSGKAERGVSWYENQADRLSMQILRKIFADDSLDLEVKLPLAQLVEEIDRVADQAEGIDQGLRARFRAGLPTVDAGETH